MISVIVPVYNSEKYLKTCIESILNQTYKNLEILLIDDGSTDDSLQIVKSYAEKDIRIKVLTKENGGQSSARNLGLDKASGHYISFIDSDDEISSDAYENAMNIFSNDSSLDIVQFPVYMNYGLPSQYLNTKAKKTILGTDNILREWITTNNISWIVCNKIFKKSIFEDLRFEKMYYEDNYMVAEIMEKISALQITETGIYYYHHRQNSTTTTAHSMQKELDTQKVNFKIYEILKNKRFSAGLPLFQSKIFNVAKSLKVNFQHESQLDDLKKEVSVTGSLKSNLSIKEKLKLLLFRFGV